MEKQTHDAVAGRKLNTHLAHSGLRLTPQRQHVYSTILEKLDHPTADQVFIRAKQEMPEISMATVYNCLDALVQCGLVRQVNLERAATRFCPNMRDHVHFYCDECSHVYDVDFSEEAGKAAFHLPKGFRATQFEASIRGLCRECAAKQRK